MIERYSWIIDYLAHEITLSFLLIIVVLLVRRLSERGIRGSARILSDSQRRSLSRLRNATVALVLIGLIAIWATELRNVALSVAAFAVALVIASKEAIMCVSGSLVVRSGERSFRVGDWIEIGKFRGEVIDHNFLTTTIEQVRATDNRHYTGKTIVLPNSLFLSDPLTNLNFSKRFVFETFRFPLSDTARWAELVMKVEERVEILCEAFLERAIQYNEAIEGRMGIDLPDANPVVRLRTDKTGGYFIEVAVFCPRAMVLELENDLCRLVLDFFAENKITLGATPTPPSPDSD